MATNDFVPFCPTDTGTNLESQTNYLADADRVSGNKPGVAKSMLVNKALRQGTWIASQFAQYISNFTGLNVVDDQNSTNLQAAMTAALVPNPKSSAIQNLGLAFSVASNAATIAIKTQALVDASATSLINVAVRSATITSGAFNLRTISSALSCTIPSGATLGQTNGGAAKIYVYLIDNAGTLEVAVSGTFNAEDQLITTTALSSSSNSALTVYSATARTSVPFRLVGYILNTQATAGTWVTTASQIQLYPVLSPSATPTGMVSSYAGSTAPAGWLLCDGSAVSRSTYTTLFQTLGTTYGSGDGSTTFNLPSLNGRVPVGAGTYTDPTLGSVTRTLAASSGEASHTLITGEMPSHNHTDSGHSHLITHNQTALGSAALTPSASGTGTQTTEAVSTGFANIQNTGGGGSHNNMQPYLVLNYIVKT